MNRKLKRLINGERGPYLIAETAYAHEGNYDYLYQQVNVINPLFVDALKFHLLLDVDGYMRKDHPFYQTVKAWLFGKEQWEQIYILAQQRGVAVIILVDDEAALAWLQTKSVLFDAVEIHSTGLNDIHLLKMARQLKKPVILGIGGSTIDEISKAIETLGKTSVILMYGFQSYPTDCRMLNLSLMPKLANLFDVITGYADHTAYDSPDNELITVMGYVLGASVIEKHFVLEKGVPRSDYEAAVTAADLHCLKSKLELAAHCLGQGKISFSSAEKIYRQPGLMKKVPLTRNTVRKGQQLQLEDVIFKRTGEKTSVQPIDIYSMLGMISRQDIGPNEIIDFTKLV